MSYTPQFTPAYEGGWKNKPYETTPIQASALNAYDDAIENIEDYLASDDSQSNIAEPYNDEDTYSEGDYCIHGGTLYKANQDIDEAEEFDPTKWDACIVTDEMGHGGGSNVSITPTLSTGTKIADFEIDGVEGELYAPTGGGGNANIWTGTQAELEEVFDELEEGTQINITDDEQEVVEGGTIYSTDEQVIGLWLDKKPLYQKTIDCGTLPNNTSKSVAHGISNIDNIVNAYGFAKTPSANQTPLPFVNNTTVGSQVAVFADDTTIVLRTSDNKTPYTISYVTLQYTKTTDAPLDAVVGKSTMYIASSDCYSTEEKEVGVNVDGKPLYQKTYISSSDATLTNSSWVTIFTLSNVDEVIQGEIIRKTADSDYIGVSCNAMVDSSGNVKYQVAQSSLVCKSGSIYTLRYTKTTDTAGSGQYTPASGKAIHYSEDEQVIGTWIDGSTLYRKIWTINQTIQSSSWVEITDVNLTGVSQLVSCAVYRTSGNGDVIEIPSQVGISSNSKLQIIPSQSTSIALNKIMLEYTKATS